MRSPRAGVLALHRLERQMKADLLVELTRVLARTEQHAQPIAEDVEQRTCLTPQARRMTRLIASSTRSKSEISSPS